MSGTVYTVASGKGGVGKTTTSVNLAVALWQEGKAVALVDADIGMANLAAVLDLEPGATLHDVLSGGATVEEALVEAQGGNLLVLPGDRSLQSFADADPGKLRDAVDELAERCDYVIVDTGAGLSYEDVLPLGMAHGVLLVTTPDPAAFGDTRKTMEVADLLGAPIRGLVVTRAAEDTDAEAIAGEIGAELLGTIPEDPAVMASTVAGNPLESHAPESGAAGAYRELAGTLLEGDEEWLEAHPREPVAPPVGDTESAAVPDETAAIDEVTGREAGQARSAAAEEPTGADDAAEFGDIMVEPGEADEEPDRAGAGDSPVDEPEAGEGGTGAEEAARDEAGASSPGTEADDLAAGEAEPSGEYDEPWAASAADLEAETTSDSGGSRDDGPGEETAGAAERPSEPEDDPDDEPPDVEQADGAADAADAEAPGRAPDREGSDAPGTPDDGGDPTAVEDADEAAESGPDAGDVEGEGAVDESGADEGPAEPGETEEPEGDAGNLDGEDEEEAGDEGEEETEPEETEEPEEDVGDVGDEEIDETGEDEEAAEQEADEKRGGFFGWLGRLFS